MKVDLGAGFKPAFRRSSFQSACLAESTGLATRLRRTDNAFSSSPNPKGHARQPFNVVLNWAAELEK